LLKGMPWDGGWELLRHSLRQVLLLSRGRTEVPTPLVDRRRRRTR
jgi:hypothetical protein